MAYSDADADTAAKTTEPDATQIKWLAVIEEYEKAFRPWKERCRKLWRIYTDEYRPRSDDRNQARKMSIFWANVSTLQPAIYAKTPEPNVTRKFKDRDPVAKSASEMIERCLIDSADDDNFDETMLSARDDFLICGRATAWVRYEAEFNPLEDDDGNALNEKGEPLGEGDEPGEEIAGERVCYDYVNWDDFGHNVARTWKEVTCVWRKAYMSRKDGNKRFGKEKFQNVTLDQEAAENIGGGEVNHDTAKSYKNKATVYEIWDKTSNKVYFIAKGGKEPLEVVDPYLQLRGFFPCPKPLYGALATNSLIPTPDYVYYQDQIEEVNDLTARIACLIDSLKVAGLYPAGASDTSAAIIKLADNATDNVLIPVPNWSQFKEGGGTKGLIEWWPVEQVIKVLEASFLARKQLIEDIYQVTGISDIMRGETDENETLGAQQLKSQFGSIRLRDRQRQMAKFARGLFRIAAEIIAEKFQPQTLMDMSNMKLPTEQDVMMKMQAQQQQMLAAQQQPQLAGPQVGA